jgi:hypothetical protein
LYYYYILILSDGEEHHIYTFLSDIINEKITDNNMGTAAEDKNAHTTLVTQPKETRSLGNLSTDSQEIQKTDL